MKSICIVLALGLNMVIADSVHTNLGTKVESGRKMLRQSNNQTSSASDTLNLPANATSIRENITDTFSCENRTYGYYADVDNECQIFHVCHPMNNSKSHNSTRRYSFICPKQTIFDQGTLVCARPIDAVNCEDAPNYYDKNLEFGKVNDTMQHQQNTSRKHNMINNKNYIKKRHVDLKTIIFNPAKSIEDVEYKKNMALEMKEEIRAMDDFEDVLDKNFRNNNEDLQVYDTKISKRTSRIKKEQKTKIHNNGEDLKVQV